MGPGTSYVVTAVNDLGMHCGDLDTRIASILPPFNVLHAQVILKGTTPQIQTDSAVSVLYSAASNSSDPALTTSNPPGFDFTGVYKTNFWTTVSLGAYQPFYPITLPSIPTDKGLPVPDPADLPILTIAQQAMPGIGVAYTTGSTNGVPNGNKPQSFARFDTNLPFFSLNFGSSFGYTVTGLNWFSADGIPITLFDDFGKVNPYPLMRVEARNKSTNQVLATVDTVTPVSGEADCRNCHTNNDATNSTLGGNGSATSRLSTNGLPIATAFNDPQFAAVVPYLWTKFSAA